MRRIAVAAPALAVALALAAGASAQYALPVTKLTGSVAPKAGAKPGKPRRAAVRAAFTVSRHSRGSVDRVVLLLPRGIRLSGAGFPRCSAQRINNEGEGSCPPGSRVGRGVARMRAGAEQTPLSFTITAHAAGTNAVALVFRGPVRRAVAARIRETGGRYGRQLSFEIPEDFRRPLPDVHARLTALSLRLGPASATVGRRDGGRRKTRRVHFATLRGCPGGRVHRFAVRLGFTADPDPPPLAEDEARDTAPC